MNLLEVLRDKIKSLDKGEHTPGIAAILKHLERSFHLLAHGQAHQDSEAFTEAIYRCNQAFEGAIKEAYRVLAEQNPDKKSLYEIEVYLQDNSIFRSRVLSQFTTYRREWRNPATHDYTLSFDDNEAFFAIVSVTIFVKLLMDQIESKLAYKQAQYSAQRVKSQAQQLLSKPSKTTSAIRHIAQTVEMALERNKDKLGDKHFTPSDLPYVIGGFLSAFPSIKVRTELTVADNDFMAHVDLELIYKNESVLVEVKWCPKDAELTKIRQVIDFTSTQLNTVMKLHGSASAILLLYAPGTVRYVRQEYPPVDGCRILILRPEGAMFAGASASVDNQ
jgi:hypothetical protein